MMPTPGCGMPAELPILMIRSRFFSKLVHDFVSRFEGGE